MYLYTPKEYSRQANFTNNMQEQKTEKAMPFEHPVRWFNLVTNWGVLVWGLRLGFVGIQSKILDHRNHPTKDFHVYIVYP